MKQIHPTIKNLIFLVLFMVIVPVLISSLLRSFKQLRLNTDYDIYIDQFLFRDRSWVCFYGNNDFYLVNLGYDNSYDKVASGDSIIHFAGSDSLYHKTKGGEVIPNEIIYYDPTSWLHELLGDTLDIEGRYGKKPWKQ
ncbi:hypothetical protein [Flammeovirga agarivorans]|uniref:Uncharacterized protein n=1 Tax=Flammeovirga agarivorans TaxID=2726742 RepID=A0A7X8XVM7_9BACT|nr:hypothetical protein [Flammeovirga agarivorans]NLR91414.1 hypothetical protein [Flammeovirga agarivorans]